MKVILDTNVLVCSVLFGGIADRILQAWRDRLIRPVLSTKTREKFERVSDSLSFDHLGVDLEPIQGLLAVAPDIMDTPALLRAPVCTDSDDDDFSACAAAAGAKLAASGDKDLMNLSGWNKILLLSPRQFGDQHPRNPQPLTLGP